MIKKNSKIFIAGHNGMIGSAILKKLISQGYKKLYFKSKASLDLRNQSKVKNYLKKIKPDAVILAAAIVGGIHANNLRKGEFIYDNIIIQSNVIHSSYLAGVKNLIFLGSNCAYPKFSKQPIKEKYLLSGYLDKTNEAYAIAKIAGINLCQSYNMQYQLNYKILMPCNSYGLGDNYDPKESHFLPSLIKKISDAINQNKKTIHMWGDGKARRELIYSADVADAVLFFLKKKTKETVINIGTGIDRSINEYAKIIMKHFGVKLKIIHQKNKLIGTPSKLLDVSLAKKYGWKYKTSLKKGLTVAIEDYLKRFSYK